MYRISRAFYSDELVTNSIRKHNISYTELICVQCKSAKERLQSSHVYGCTFCPFVRVVLSLSFSLSRSVRLARRLFSCCWWNYVCACTINYVSDDLQIDYYPFKSTPMHGNLAASSLTLGNSNSSLCMHTFIHDARYLLQFLSAPCLLAFLHMPETHSVCVVCPKPKFNRTHEEIRSIYFWLHYCRIIYDLHNLLNGVWMRWRWPFQCIY